MYMAFHLPETTKNDYTENDSKIGNLARRLPRFLVPREQQCRDNKGNSEVKSVLIIKIELDCIINAVFIDKKTKLIVEKNTKKEKNLYKIRISEKLSESIRDKCGEQLQISGFDEN